jgi:hypothetical protein
LRKLPSVVRQTLPAVLRGDGGVFLPQLGFINDSNGLAGLPDPAPTVAQFRPQEPLTASAFVVV